MAAPLSSVADKILAIDAALAGALTATVAYSVKQFADFEDIMLKVKGVMGASASEYEELTTLTEELGATTRYTATEAAQGLEFLALAGFDAQEAIASLPTVLQLAQASTLELGRTSDLLTDIMAGYGIEIAEIGKVTDVLTATFTNSTQNLEQLGYAFSYVGPVAKSMGIEIEETASILGLLADAGFKGEKGGTALRNMLLRLVAPTSNAGKLFEKLGVDTQELGVDLKSSASALDSLGVKVLDTNGNLRPMSKIMRDLQEGLKNVGGEAQQTAILAEIFGVRGGPQMAALLIQGADAVEELEKKIRDAKGVTSEIAEEMESGLGGTLRALRSGFESITQEIGKQLKDGVSPALGGLTVLFRTFTNEIKAGQFDEIIDVVNGFGISLGKAFDDIAKNLPEALENVDVSGIIEALHDLRQSLGEIFDDVDLSTPEGLASATQSIVDSIESLIRVTDGMVQAFKPMVQAVISAIGDFNKLGNTSKEEAGKIVGAAKAITTFGLEVTLALAAIQQSGTDLRAAFSIAIDSVLIMWEGLVSVIRGAKAIIADQVAELFQNFQEYAKDLGGVLDYLPDWTPGVDSLRNAVSDMENNLSVLAYAAKQHNQNMQEDYDETAQSINDRLQRIGENLAGNAAETEKASEKIQQANEKVVQSFDKVTESSFNPFQEIDTGDYVQKMEEVQGILDDLVSHGLLTGTDAQSIQIAIDEGELDKAKKLLDTVPQGLDVEILPAVDAVALEQAEKTLEEKLPESIKLQYELDIETVKQAGETLRTAMEENSKIATAQIEADSEKIQKAMEFNKEAFISTGETIRDTLGLIADLDPVWDSTKFNLFEDQLKASNDRADRTLAMQEKLTDAQIRLMLARAKAMETGEALINVTAPDSIMPHLEAIWLSVLEYVQIHATEAGIDSFLLGLEPT